MGFPIRKSADQSSFAAPHGLSQRITSFIASQRQGIHRMLLRHLIVLMIDVRSNQAARQDQKDHYACRIDPILAISQQRWTNRTLQDEQLSNLFPLHDDKQRYSSSPSDNQQNLTNSGFLVEPDGIEPTT